MIHGMGKAMSGANIDDDAFKSIEAIIHSMTPAERENPDLLNGKRRERLARGSGTTIQEVNRLMKQFEDMRKMMKMMNSKDGMSKLMSQMKNIPGMKGMM